MSIKSTRTITRAQAIARIYEINALAVLGDYKGIEDTTFERDCSIKDFVKAICLIPSINRCTDSMLEEVMDLPFYRYSMFDNYRIGEED